MALIKCGECGTEISDKAAACVKCGAPVVHAVVLRSGVLGGLFVAFAVLCAAGLLMVSTTKSDDKASASPPVASVARPSPPPAPVQDTTPPIEITAQQLMQEYQANEVAADMKFKGKKLQVTGIVVEISKNIFDEPYVMLSTGDDFSRVQASFSKGGERSLASVAKGETLVINCTGNGMVIRSPILKCAAIESDDARITAARADVNTLIMALKLYRLDNQTYPSQDQGLDALLHKPAAEPVPPNWKPYLDKLPNDPWGHPYQYLKPGVKGEIDVMSFGADGLPGGEGENADIGSWQ